MQSCNNKKINVIIMVRGTRRKTSKQKMNINKYIELICILGRMQPSINAVIIIIELNT